MGLNYCSVLPFFVYDFEGEESVEQENESAVEIIIRFMV